MKPRPKQFVLVLAVLGVLLGGCGAPSEPESAQPVAGELATTAGERAADPAITTEPAVTTEPAAAPTTTVAAVPTTTAPKPRPQPTTKPTTRKPTPKPTTKKPTPKPTTKAPGKTVHPGAFCKPEGAIGYTVKGTRMRCTRKAGEDQPRWRAA